MKNVDDALRIDFSYLFVLKLSGKSKNVITLRPRPLLSLRFQKGQIRGLDNIFFCHSAMAQDIKTFFSLHNGSGTFVLSQTFI